MTMTDAGCCGTVDAARKFDWFRHVSDSMGFSDLLLGIRYVSCTHTAACERRMSPSLMPAS